MRDKNIGFARPFIVWFIGFILNLVPLLYECSILFMKTKMNNDNYNFFLEFFSSNELNFIAFVSIFILVIELLFMKIYKKSQLQFIWKTAFIFSLYFFIIYTFFSIYSEIYEHFNSITLTVSHIVNIFLVLFFAIYSINLQIKE